MNNQRLLILSILLIFLIFLTQKHSLEIDSKRVQQINVKKSTVKNDQILMSKRNIANIDFTEPTKKSEPQKISPEYVKRIFSKPQIISFRPPDQNSMLWQQPLQKFEQLQLEDSNWKFFENTMIQKINDQEVLNRLHQSGNYQWVMQPMSLNHLNINDGYPATYNQLTRKLGLFTGNIIVQLKDKNYASDLVFQYNLELNFLRDKKAIYSPRGTTDYIQLSQALKNDSKVDHFKFEIIANVIGIIQ